MVVVVLLRVWYFCCLFDDKALQNRDRAFIKNGVLDGWFGLVVCLWSIEAAVHYGASWLGSEKVKMVKWRLTQFKPSFLSTSEPFEKRAYFQQNVWTFDK